MLVPLTKGKFAVIDTADADIVRPYTWCVTGSDPLFYAIASMRGEDGKARMVLMHRLLMGDPPEEVEFGPQFLRLERCCAGSPIIGGNLLNGD